MKLCEFTPWFCATCPIHCPPLFSVMFHYSEDIELGIRFMRIAESLINGHPNEQNLSAKLTLFMCTVISQVEPFQATPERIFKGCNSALLAGEIDMAMSSSLNRTIFSIHCIPDLVSVQKDIVHFFHRCVSFTSVSFRQI